MQKKEIDMGPITMEEIVKFAHWSSTGSSNHIKVGWTRHAPEELREWDMILSKEKDGYRCEVTRNDYPSGVRRLTEIKYRLTMDAAINDSYMFVVGMSKGKHGDGHKIKRTC